MQLLYGWEHAPWGCPNNNLSRRDVHFPEVDAELVFLLRAHPQSLLLHGHGHRHLTITGSDVVDVLRSLRVLRRLPEAKGLFGIYSEKASLLQGNSSAS